MNMKKILSIALSLVMIMALFTGCGSNKNAKTKDNGSYFKEVKKMQEIKTGTGEVQIQSRKIKLYLPSSRRMARYRAS